MLILTVAMIRLEITTFVLLLRPSVSAIQSAVCVAHATCQSTLLRTEDDIHCRNDLLAGKLPEVSRNIQARQISIVNRVSPDIDDKFGFGKRDGIADVSTRLYCRTGNRTYRKGFQLARRSSS